MVSLFSTHKIAVTTRDLEAELEQAISSGDIIYVFKAIHKAINNDFIIKPNIRKIMAKMGIAPLSLISIEKCIINNDCKKLNEALDSYIEKKIVRKLYEGIHSDYKNKVGDIYLKCTEISETNKLKKQYKIEKAKLINKINILKSRPIKKEKNDDLKISADYFVLLFLGIKNLKIETVKKAIYAIKQSYGISKNSPLPLHFSEQYAKYLQEQKQPFKGLYNQFLRMVIKRCYDDSIEPQDLSELYKNIREFLIYQIPDEYRKSRCPKLYELEKSGYTKEDGRIDKQKIIEAISEAGKEEVKYFFSDDPILHGAVKFLSSKKIANNKKPPVPTSITVIDTPKPLSINGLGR